MAYYLTLPFVVALIFSEDGKVLIGRQGHNDNKPYPGLWDLPAGKLKENETIKEGLIRETKEETGFDVTQCELFDVFHSHSGTFLKNVSNLIPGVAICYKVAYKGEFDPQELEQMGWYTIKEAKKLKLTPWTRHFLEQI